MNDILGKNPPCRYPTYAANPPTYQYHCQHCYCIDIPASAGGKAHKACCNCGNRQVNAGVPIVTPRIFGTYTTYGGIP